MFFIVVIVLLVLYQSHSGKASVEELWFMMSLFAGGAYIGGFLDSRIFARLDKNRANLLAEAEARYEASEQPATAQQETSTSQTASVG